MKQQKSFRRFRKDQSALSSVITVAGIIAAIMGFVVAPILTVYVPNQAKDAEAEHMDDTADTFAQLRGNINKLIEREKQGSQVDVRLSLGTELNNLFMPDSTGALYLHTSTPELKLYNSENPVDLYTKSYGSIEYKAKNNEYINQRYVYENGAIIVEQAGSSTMDLRPDIDIGSSAEGRVFLNDDSVYGYLPGIDTTHPNAVYYNFTRQTGDVSLSYDIYNNNKNIFETDFDDNGAGSLWEDRKNDWFIENELDRNNVIAKWTFSETQTTAFEESADSLSTHDGSLAGSAEHTTGKFGQGIEFFPATKSRITVGNTATLQFTGSHTLECWIKPDDVIGSKYIVSKIKESASSGYAIMLADDELKYLVGDGTTIQTLQTAGADIPVGVWTHVAGAWDGSKMYAYVNGVKLAEKSFSGSMASNSFKLVFGSNLDENGNFFDGVMDEIIISSAAKSSFDLTDGILSVRGDIWGGEDEGLTLLDRVSPWVAQESNADWKYRKRIGIKASQVEDDLYNFPVLIKLSDNDVKSRARFDGYDIIFTSADSVTRLDHEIESYVSSTGSLTAWVKVPALSASTDTVIYMYYGNSAISSSTANSDGVWDTNFVGVWHLDEEESGTANTDTYEDSTSNANHGDDYVSATGQDGKINGAQEFDGSGDHIPVPHDAGLDLRGSMTISFWIKPTSDTSAFNRVVEKGMLGYQTSYYFGCGDGQNDLTFYLSDTEVFDTSNNVLTKNAWQHAAVSYNSGGTATLYLNGADTTTGTYSGSITGNSGTLYISHSDSGLDFPGYIDEVRISDLDRSSAWLKTEYRNQNNPGNFYSIDGEVNYDTIAKSRPILPESLENKIYRKQITIKSSEVSSDLTDFPVLVSLTDPDLSSRARADGYDIYFTTSDGETRLDHEIERYSSGPGSLVAWVRVPVLSSTVDTVIYMNYGNPDSSDQSNSEGVWPSNYRAVWHLTENPAAASPQFADSTSNSNDGTNMGGMTSANQTAGKIDGSIKFGGTDDKINVGADSSINIAENATISGWFKLPSAHSSTTSSRILIEKHIDNDHDFAITLAGHDYDYSTIPKGSMVMKIENHDYDGGIRYKYTTRTSWSANTWYYFTALLDATENSNNKIYVNAAEDTAGNIGDSTIGNLDFNSDWNLGGGNVDSANIATGVNHSDANIDEVRIATGLRSNGWLSTEYSNQNNPGNFYSVGNEEVVYNNESGVIIESRVLANDYSGKKMNAFVVFDHQSDTNYKYAGIRADTDKWVVGHRTSSGYVDDATATQTLDVNTWYNLSVEIDQDTVRLYSDGFQKAEYTFSSISGGRFGLANDKSHSHFDDVKIYYKANNGIQIWINNKQLSEAQLTPMHRWDGPYNQLISGELLDPNGANVIKFKNVYSPTKIWALRNVIIRGNPKEVSLSLITIDSEEKTIGGSGSHVLHTKLTRLEVNHYDFDTPSNVTLELTSNYADAWMAYFNDRMNETGSSLKWDPDKAESDYYLWSEPYSADARTVYLKFNKIERLSCTIAVITVIID